MRRLATVSSGENRQEPLPPWVFTCFRNSNAPVIATTDYVRAVPELIRAQITARYVTLGTDGFGRSDTRAGLRRFFEIDKHWIVFQALATLAETGAVAPAVPGQAAQRYAILFPQLPPWQR